MKRHPDSQMIHGVLNLSECFRWSAKCSSEFAVLACRGRAALRLCAHEESYRRSGSQGAKLQQQKARHHTASAGIDCGFIVPGTASWQERRHKLNSSVGLRREYQRGHLCHQHALPLDQSEADKTPYRPRQPLTGSSPGRARAILVQTPVDGAKARQRG